MNTQIPNETWHQLESIVESFRDEQFQLMRQRGLHNKLLQVTDGHIAFLNQRLEECSMPSLKYSGVLKGQSVFDNDGDVRSLSSEQKTLLLKELVELKKNLFNQYHESSISEPQPTRAGFLHRERLMNAHGFCNHLITVCRAVQSDASFSIFRQMFIVSVALFDATVFDLLHCSLKANYRETASMMNWKTNKLTASFESLADLVDFSALTEHLASESLRGKYIRELLSDLPKCVILHFEKRLERHVDGKVEKHYDFSRLLEAVGRRNIHVHNRGRVDRRYLDDVNIDGLRLDDFAEISESYLSMVNDHFSNYIHCLQEELEKTLGCHIPRPGEEPPTS